MLKDLDAGERIATVAADFWYGGCEVAGGIEAVVGFFSVQMRLQKGVVAVVVLQGFRPKGGVGVVFREGVGGVVAE